ncbi:RNA polymerase sigma factor [Alicyclobacillus fastidiosus]|uniref:RNA polymerase sigma factor n=1 Tax=Alicyclobacillus fastidiosus TaxID=392011 RepID=A0ABV5ALX5_9BACL|nr:sigma-70 family RNA polymerase sigma factor [Alicyclobacillus fastidiosus]WEH09016.1 sigma-70 family RNA polymerase sigma factor [Alicyclobacillus fastidiosus]
MTNPISESEARKIFIENKDFIYKTVYLFTRSRAVADDITQETFIRAFKNYNSYDQSKPIRPWLYKIAINVARNTVRSGKWKLVYGDIPETPVPSADNSLYQSEERKQLIEEIYKLSLKMRQVVILHYFNELTIPEVADVLNIPVGTCKSRLNLALATLRKSMRSDQFLFKLDGGTL